MNNPNVDIPFTVPPPREHVPAVRQLAAVFAAASLPPAAPPEYDLVAPLGRGAMGEVYLARHRPLDRLVAIKFVLLDRIRGNADMQARFSAEARSTARMHHPNIIGIHEVGENLGRPFMVLEYADDGSLATRLSAGPIPSKNAARMVATIASAVQHAHEQGIIHRDLKPGNVLLLTSGELKVSDFGLAGPTGVGGQVGTPSYMAPEQASGEAAGTAADVWAIGAILYECLTGRPPFRGASTAETLEQVRNWDPVSPRQLMPSVPRDLETVCLKCLQKQPGDRYDTACDIAQDLERFLNGEPVKARQVGLGTRLVKWAKRRPLPASLTLLLVLAALGLVIGGLIYQERLRQAVHRAETNAADAERERLRAEANYQQAAAAVDRFLSRVGDERLKAVAEMEGVRAELLVDALEFYRRLAADSHSADLNVRYEAAKSGRRVADVLLMLGREAEAETAYREAITRITDLTTQHPAELRFRIEAAAAWQQLADQLARARSPDTASVLDSAAARWTRLAAENPDEPSFMVNVAAVENLRGIWLKNCGQIEQAETAHTAAVAGFRAALARRTDDLGFRRQLAVGLHNLSTLRLHRGKIAEALAAETDAVAVFETVYRDDPHDLDAAGQLAAGLNNLGTHLSNSSRNAEAIAALTRSLAIRKQMSARHPRYVPWRDGVAESALSLAGACLTAGQGVETAAAGQQAAEVYRGLAAEFPKQPQYRFWLVGALQNTAQGLAMTARKAEALTTFDEAASVLEALLRKHPDSANYWERLSGLALNRGNLDMEAGRTSEAATWFARGAEAGDKALGLSPQLREARLWRVYNLASQAMALGRLKDSSSAVVVWDRAVDTSDNTLRTEIRLMRLPALLAARRYDRLEQEWDELSKTTDAVQLVAVARSASRASVALATDAKKSATVDNRTEAYAMIAVKLLRQAGDTVPEVDRLKMLNKWVVSLDFVNLLGRTDVKSLLKMD